MENTKEVTKRTIHGFKIKPYYADLIKQRIKTHEYRLADQRGLLVDTGDILCFSCQDELFYCLVEAVEKFDSWLSAICLDWREDFAGFRSLNDAL